MGSTTSPVHEMYIPLVPTTVSQQEPAPGGDSQIEVSDEALPLDVTSNIRQGSLSPSPPSLKDHYSALLSLKRISVPCDATYDLPAPDLTPRFVFRIDDPSDEETPPLSISDGANDVPPPIQSAVQEPTGPSPRIYFGDSAITFIPPFCYDSLERDPTVKSVPRNYRAWTRTGRPKLDIEALERAEAKNDFLAMRLPFPQDAESEESGDEKEKERKRKRKKRAAARALMVPMERPRRMVRKVGGAKALTKHLAPTIHDVDRMSEEETPPFEVPVSITGGGRHRMVSNSVEKSDNRERRPISTLLGGNIAETKTNKKRPNSDNKAEDIFSAKKQRVSRRSYVQEHSPSQDGNMSSDAEHPANSLSSLSDWTSTPEPQLPTSLPENPDRKPRLMQTLRKTSLSRIYTRPALGETSRSTLPRASPLKTVLSPSGSISSIRHGRLMQTLRKARPSPIYSTPALEGTSRSTLSRASPIRTALSPRELKSPIRQDRLVNGIRKTLIHRPTSESPPGSIPSLASRPGHRVNRDHPSCPSTSVQMRTFPASIPIIPGYPGFYRRYPFITQFDRDDPIGKHIIPDDSQPKRSLGNWNPPRESRDLYTPRYTKGSGNKKLALCPICFEDTARGGEGRQEWNHTKTSQHNYHMQYYHGISATRCAPFSPPIAKRSVPVVRPQSNEKSEILQGKCHNCKQWIPLEGCKTGDLKVKELFWWKHAAGCHKDSNLLGETDIFIEDTAYRRLQEYEATNRTEN